MWTFFTSFFEKLFQKTTATSFILAIIAAIIIAAIMGASFGELTNFWPPTFASVPSRHFAPLSFVITFLVLMPVLYIMLLNEGDDYLTPLRKELCGTWSVYYQDWEIDHAGAIVSQEFNDIAKLDINVVTRKLYIHSTLHNHKVFEDFERNIESISINPQSKPVEVIFFYRLGLKTRDGHALDGDIFVKMILECDEKNKPVKMIGRWHDLDGKFAASKKTFYEAQTGTTLEGEFATSGTVRYEKQ